MNLNVNRKYFLTMLFMIFFALLMYLIYLLQVHSNKNQTEHTAAILFNQIARNIDRNQRDEALLLNSLQEDYMVRAKAVAYILDNSPQIMDDVAELNKIAKLTKVDEIHIFDESGTIRSGNLPKYYGYSMDSGEQMAYFKPMLLDKTLSMCQDMVLNTAESKPMMYAICWNKIGTCMIQVGIEPKRLLHELKANDIQNTIHSLALHDGVTVLAADNTSGKIRGATLAELVGKNFEDVGIAARAEKSEQTGLLEGWINGQRSYYTVHSYGMYLIAIIQEKKILSTAAFLLFWALSAHTFFWLHSYRF
ncbi:hypothetical protein [Desulfovibrio sp. SGI.169]|uniref:hypothetical protein n=1 Tax=Desulfovibrio sp. SGI.169 TaxID=3420561 RepID=UPI003D06B67D